MMIYTTKGLIEREKLIVRDIVTEEQTSRVTATEWFLDGELVRRDVNVNILAPLEIGSIQGDTNG